MAKPDLTSPFPGLRPFLPHEANLFFGRERQREELLRILRRNRLVAVVGTSGSGKSSLVRAGLVPRLLQGFRGRGGSQWQVATMRPGNNPIGRLAEVLTGTADDADSPSELETTISETTLRRSALGLVEVAHQLRLAGNLLLVVDQFEEIFRIGRGDRQRSLEDERAAFVRLLLEAVRQREQPIHVVLTMRSDYLGDCARFLGLPESINRGQYLVPRLDRDARRETIVGPVRLRGAEIAPRLVHRLLNDAGENPDQLPISQHALMRTWEQWLAASGGEGPIDLEHYEAIGTMAEALERHAEECLAELSGKRQLRIAELMLKRLTEKGADNREIRRPTTAADICQVAEASIEEVTAVADVFRHAGRSFLVPGSEKPIVAGTLLDISHESLIRGWRRLRGWVEEEATSAEQYLRLAKRMEDMRLGLDTYLKDPALRLALEWREQHRPNAAWAQRYHPNFDEALEFLTKSAARDQQERQEKAAARRRELEQARALAAEQQRRLETQARAARRLIFLAVILAVFMAAALVAAWLAVRQSRRADAEARLATSYGLVAAAEGETDPLRRVLLALHASAVTHEAEGTVTAEAWDLLNRSVQEAGPSRQAGTGSGPVAALALAPGTPELVAAAGRDGGVELFDPRSQKIVGSLEPGAGGVFDVAFDAAGSRLLIGGRDGTIQAWATGGERILSRPAHQGATSVVATGPGSTAASGGWDGQVALWDLDSGERVASLADQGEDAAHLEAVMALAFGPEGSLLASGGRDRMARVWDLRLGRSTHELEHPEAVTAVIFANEGGSLITGCTDGAIRVWDLASNREPRHFGEGGGPILEAVFDPVNGVVFSAGWDPRIRSWDLATGQALVRLAIHSDRVAGLALSDDGRRLYSGGDDRRLVAWNIGRQDTYPESAWSTTWKHTSDDSLYAGIEAGGREIHVENRSGERLLTFTVGNDTVVAIAFSADESRLAARTLGSGLREFYLEVDPLAERATELLGDLRLTERDCDLHFPNKPCPDLPRLTSEVTQ
jgi:WD40 repeat protein